MPWTVGHGLADLGMALRGRVNMGNPGRVWPPGALVVFNCRALAEHATQPTGTRRTVAVAAKLMVSGAEQEGHLHAPTAAAVNSPMQPRQKACPHSADTGSCQYAKRMTNPRT